MDWSSLSRQWGPPQDPEGIIATTLESQPAPALAVVDAAADNRNVASENREHGEPPAPLAAMAEAPSLSLPAPSLRQQIRTYRVRPGDTLQGIADRAGISLETLIWANALRDPNHLLVGQPLTVLPVTGVLYTLGVDETIQDVADRFAVAAARLIEANALEEPYVARAGDRLIVPDGRPQPKPAAAAGPSAWPAPGTGDRNREQFIAAAVSAAQASQRRTQVPASVVLAQAIHESYWGTSKLAREANNLFGIKARNGAGTAGTYWMDAWEVINGQNVVVPEPFRAYASPADSFVDHGLFFHQNSRYHGAFAHTADPRAFARAIAAAGYATDPDYAPKLIRIMDQWNLYQYDVT